MTHDIKPCNCHLSHPCLPSSPFAAIFIYSTINTTFYTIHIKASSGIAWHSIHPCYRRLWWCKRDIFHLLLPGRAYDTQYMGCDGTQWSSMVFVRDPIHGMLGCKKRLWWCVWVGLVSSYLKTGWFLVHLCIRLSNSFALFIWPSNLCFCICIFVCPAPLHSPIWPSCHSSRTQESVWND